MRTSGEFLEPTSLEADIQAAGLMAPRVHPEDLEREIVEAQFYVFPNTTTTVCCITMRNGNTVIGESACVDPRNFNIGIGRKAARDKAIEKMWPLLGFRLRDQLCDAVNTPETTAPEEVTPPPAFIEPAVPVNPVALGDQVLYYEQLDGQVTEPMVGIVSKVLGHDHVSLVVFAPNGTPHARSNVLLVYPWMPRPESPYYACPKS